MYQNPEGAKSSNKQEIFMKNRQPHTTFTPQAKVKSVKASASPIHTDTSQDPHSMVTLMA